MRIVPAILYFLLGAVVTAVLINWSTALSLLSIMRDHDTTTAIATTTILAVIVAVWGVVSQRAIARRQLTYQQIVKFLTDKDVIDARRKFIEIAKSNDGLSPYAASDKETSIEHQQINLTMNFFELFSIGVQKGVIDYDLFKMWNRSTVIQYWNYARPFATALRTRLGNDLLFCEFEQLANWFKADQGPRKHGWRWSLFF